MSWAWSGTPLTKPTVFAGKMLALVERTWTLLERGVATGVELSSLLGSWTWGQEVRVGVQAELVGRLGQVDAVVPAHR